MVHFVRFTYIIPRPQSKTKMQKTATATAATKRRRDDEGELADAVGVGVGVGVRSKKQRDGEGAPNPPKPSNVENKSAASNLQANERVVKLGFFSETEFGDLPLSEPMLGALDALKFTTMTKIQAS